ncbi:hypothetical protein ZOSMA_357G00070 [Zostera marina]|uniref:Uncharacterized protein n=1 Tax=Zostera marina TaxID=29655 RepID=A0A0K9P914_ZOSMR|nr:hypothetical protein ZOSMA_357G00070 [Zostera marina]
MSLSVNYTEVSVLYFSQSLDYVNFLLAQRRR